jgi:hypothetical protein
MNLTRTITLSLVLAATALVPAAALGSHGADDNPAVADDHGGQLTAGEHSTVPDDKAGQGAASSKAGGRAARRATGQCTGNATSKLKVKPDNRRLQTEFEVDQNRSGVTWKVTIRRNGNMVVTTNATTRAPSGSFSVERRLSNGSGSDTITARATSPSGEVCTASITV